MVSLSYPYGAYEEWGRDILESCGIEYAVTTVHEDANLDGNWYKMSRHSGDMILNIRALDRAK